MLEPTMRDLMEEAGVRDVKIREDDKGLLGTGEFPGTARQIRNRLGGELDLDLLESADEPTQVRCRPLS